jgi:predicted MPP superfamily phosphohydrolase
LPWFKGFMRDLCEIAPVLSVRGNWEMMPYWESRDIFGGTHVTEMRSKAVTLNVRGTPLYFWGQDFYPEKLLPRDPAPQQGVFTILLNHTPDLMPEAVAARFDLYLAAHTHGGQIALPWYGALITFSRFDKRYESGLYREGSTTLYVNRGIGLARWPQPQARFLSRPEITVIELVPSPDSSSGR